MGEIEKGRRRREVMRESRDKIPREIRETGRERGRRRER